VSQYPRQPGKQQRYEQLGPGVVHPSDRMTTTFCVASKSPTPNQIDAIQNQRGDFERMELTSIGLTSILRMIFYGSVGEANNAGIACSVQPTVWPCPGARRRYLAILHVCWRLS